MIWTVDQVLPAIGENYRHRKSGRVARLHYFHRYVRPNTGWVSINLARLTDENGWEWIGTTEDFWEDWIHADVPDPRRN